MKGMLETMNGPLLLALRFRERYWISSKAGHVRIMETNVYDLHAYSRGNEAFSGLGGGTVCLRTILYLARLQRQAAAQLPLLGSRTQHHGHGCCTWESLGNLWDAF